MSHAHLSIFATLVGRFRPVDPFARRPGDFAWHIGSIFLLLLAAWQLLGICFESRHARWSGVAVLAATLSVPVTGTALAIMDPYLTARSLSTPASLFAIVSTCRKSRGGPWRGCSLTAARTWADGGVRLPVRRLHGGAAAAPWRSATVGPVLGRCSVCRC